MSRKRSAPLHVVILAGGAGERFWPASRKRLPKPLLRVVGKGTLLDATLARARRLTEAERIWVVCGCEHARAVRRATGLPASRVLVEPRRRNTAMAVAWAALRIRAKDPNAVMAVLPADHRIRDVRRFAAAIARAARAAQHGRALVTLGIEPTGPATGYGYIQQGPPAGAEFPGVYRVRRFVEKPDRVRARRYLRSGGYRWNSGIFVWSAVTLLEELERLAPELHRALAPLRRRPSDRRRSVVEAAYRRAPSVPVDVAILERSRRVWTLPVDFTWSDVGTWTSLARELGVAPAADGTSGRSAGNAVVGGEALFEDSTGNLVWGHGRPLALLGVENLAVIDTGDVILITKLGGNSDVRRIVARLRERGRLDLL